MRPCPPTIASPRSRPPTWRRATRATGSTSHARAASPPTPRRSRPRRAPPSRPCANASPPGTRAACGADDEGNRPYPPGALDGEDARALASIRAGIETAFGADAELPVAPVVERGGLRRRRRVGRGDRGRRHRAPGAAGGLLRLRADALELDGGRTAPAAGPRATGDGPGSRRSPAPVPRAVAAVAGGRRRRAGRASPYRALIRESRARWPRAAPHRQPTSARSGSSAATVERWAIGDPRRLARRGGGPGRAPGEPPIEPWDWWWRAGEADRALATSLPLDASSTDRPPRSTRPSAPTSRRSASASTRRRDPVGRRCPWPSRRSGRGRIAVPTAGGTRAAPTVFARLRGRRPGRPGRSSSTRRGMRSTSPHPDAAGVRRLAGLRRAHRGARRARGARRRASPPGNARWIDGAPADRPRPRSAARYARGRPRHRVGPVRDPAPRRTRTGRQRRLDRDHPE